MADVNDVAAYVLKLHGPMSAMKLQKLAYYSQAWSLVWDEKALFRARIEAWANGPVCPALYRGHRGKFLVSSWDGDWKRLSEEERHTIDTVVDFYGKRDPQWLSDLTHREAPWSDARKGLAPGERGYREISQAAMAEYYGSL